MSEHHRHPHANEHQTQANARHTDGPTHQPPRHVNADHFDLAQAALDEMHEAGFKPEFGPGVAEQVGEIREDLRKEFAKEQPGFGVPDLRNLAWSSIDNDTSRDLDQIEVAEKLPNGDVKIMIGIADVDAYVPKNTPIDQHAARETTTV